MRAGPLSSDKVIFLLNSYFVPVFVSNEDYRDGGSATPEDKAEFRRIFREAREAKLSVGTVHVYLLNAAGHPVDSLHVAKAARTDELVLALERMITRLEMREGKPLVKPGTSSLPPATGANSLVLHLTARLLDGRGAWGNFPVENWIPLAAEQWTKLLPQGKLQIGQSWDIDPEVATAMLTHFYPATENNDVSKNRFEQQSLKATIVSLENGIATARLEGAIKMKHSFYHRADAKVVEATVVGFLSFVPDQKRIRSLRLVTQHATYNGGHFGVALHSVPVKVAAHK